MTATFKWPDTEEILSQLKGFQRDTVEFAFERLYLAKDSSRRFLVADEVGLGKTLVARGVIAKAVEHLRKEGIERIDVLYICSNAEIARQNINRLNLTRDRRFELATRITLLPTILHDLRNSPLNFVSFTPGTSFDLKSSLGRSGERILLYWMIREVWGNHGAGALNLFQGNVGNAGGFRKRIRAFDQSSIDQEIQVAFSKALGDACRGTRDGRPGLRARYEELCDRFSYARKSKRPREDREMRAHLIGELRALLAAVCLEALEPDLIILDEFQRFKHLLSGESDAGRLARELFNYADDVSQVRMLLLSATPYKMYTLRHERDEDDHHADFLCTVEFLQQSSESTTRFALQLKHFRRELYRLGEGGEYEISALRDEIEDSLRRVMSRTERIVEPGEDGTRGDMLKEVSAQGVTLKVEDVRAFTQLQRVASALDQPQVVEYWKSAPFLLNFMRQYKLKEKFREQAESHENRTNLAQLLEKANKLLLPWNRIEAYERVEPGNARVRNLVRELDNSGAWQLLWMPPSLPSYQLGADYKRAADTGLTKRLVFSAWTVVPQALATLVSYEVERRIFTRFENKPENTIEARRRRRPLLRFARTNERLTGMPVLGILYPSFTLALLGDPLAHIGADSAAPLLTLAAVLERIGDTIKDAVVPLTRASPTTGPEDGKWYWAAPILLDLSANREAAETWFARTNLPSLWAGDQKDEDTDSESRWEDHVGEARKVVLDELQLGRPPADLHEVLAEIALAGPGTTALRALARVAGGGERLASSAVRDGAARVAWSSRTLFSQPEATALIRGGVEEGTREASWPYWRLVVRHAANGGFGAVLDEYAHVLRDSLGLFGEPSEETTQDLAEAMRNTLALRTSRLDVDEIRANRARGEVSIENRSLRAHFAMRFGSDKREAEEAAQRADRVRAAFNSPFWPFVLATTSVGQEGLDFHSYCHAVVHWNLPSNPVDLEQREGRVHRYKGHAIRKNVAREFGRAAMAAMDGDSDPWQRTFELANEELGEGDHGLVPFWVFSPEGGARVERHVPALPLSRDRVQLEDLRRSLVVYRMVFGQPRQDDLLAYLLETLGPDEIERFKPLLRIDLTPAGLQTRSSG